MGAGNGSVQQIEKQRMNINVRQSHLLSAVRSPVTLPLTLPPPTAQNSSLPHSWPLHRCDFYVTLDHMLSLKIDAILASIAELQQASFSQSQHPLLVEQLEDWLALAKKMEFYRIEPHLRRLFNHENGLLAMIGTASIRCIYLLSEIQKYGNPQPEGLTLAELRRQQVEIIFRDVSLKLSKHILSELRSEMYQSGQELVSRLLKFYSISHDNSRNFEENYQTALQEKKMNGESREGLIVLFTMKVIWSLNSSEGLCFYLSYLKNILLDRSSGVLTADYETWTALYEATLKLYARCEQARINKWLQVDQILSSSLSDPEFQQFLLRNCQNENVSLSSLNFYLKNSRREEREEIRSVALRKVDELIRTVFWQSLEDVYQFVDCQLNGELQETYLKTLSLKTRELVNASVPQLDIYHAEYGLTFLLENALKHPAFTNLLDEELLQEMVVLLKSDAQDEHILLVFRLFNQFLSGIYAEGGQEDWHCSNLPLLLQLGQLFSRRNLLCSKPALKLFYCKLSAQPNQFLEEKMITMLAHHYFTGGYQENSDLQLIHSHEDFRDLLASKILFNFQLLVAAQLVERKELLRCLDGECKVFRNSYLAVRSSMESLFFESIQNICLVFSSQLSMQTLEFGLNYYTPLSSLPMWNAQQEQLTLLSLISEEMPIETLKFVFRQLIHPPDFELSLLRTIPPLFWQHFWSEDRRGVIQWEGLRIQQFDALQRLRRLEFVLSLGCCVFDKLNEHSQRNIKEIRTIYESGAEQLARILLSLRQSFFEAGCLQLAEYARLQPEEIKNLPLLAEQRGSFMLGTFVANNGFVQIGMEFNRIGAVNQSPSLASLQNILLPPFIKTPTHTITYHEVLRAQVEVCLMLQSTWLHKLGDNEAIEDMAHLRISPLQINKQWAKQAFSCLTRLNNALKKQNQGGEGWHALKERINDHLKNLIGRVMLPQILGCVLGTECRPQLARVLFTVMRAGIELIFTMDADYEEHFMVMIEKVEQAVRQVKGEKSSIQAGSILSLLELFFELIFSRIRIRSYHLYRIIRYYQKITGEGLEQFNCIIAQHMRLLFEQFITNYKTLAEVHLLCGKRSQTALIHKFQHHEHTLTAVEAACTLSMFINLLCRLNHPSLSAGIEKIFAQDEAKAIYLDYLTALTRRIASEPLPIPTRDIEILKIDVYGNLTVLSRGKLSERLLNKLVSLAKNLLRVKADLRGVNKLPVKLLAQKIGSEQLEVSLQEFEDECRAMSLGAISLHRRLGSYVSSNLHLCNLYFLTGRNLEKYLELNQTVLGLSRQEVSAEAARIAREGVSALRISIGEELAAALEQLMRKLEKYYEVSLRDGEYVQKLYGLFKILCIACLNNPEIIPLVLTQSIVVNKQAMNFEDFVLLTLKHSLPLFCEFYITVLKTNSGFRILTEELTISYNLQMEISLRQKILALFKKQIEAGTANYPFLTKAICFIQQYSQSSRFRFYKFVKNSNEPYEAILKEHQKEFNLEIIRICEIYIQRKSNSYPCQDIYEILGATMDKHYTHSSILDCKKFSNEQAIRYVYIPHMEHDSNKQNVPEAESKRYTESARSKNSEFIKYKPALAQIMKPHQHLGYSSSFTKGMRLKEHRQLRLNCLQEDIIGLSECKYLSEWWNVATVDSSINKIMIDKFKFFNEEIENREFMKDAIIFPSKNGVDVLPPTEIVPQCDSINQDDPPSSKDSKQKSSNRDDIIQSIETIKEEQLCNELANFSSRIIEESTPVEDEMQGSLNFAPQNSDSIIYSEIQIDNCEDGSMKLFGEEEEAGLHEEEEIREVNKHDIVQLIEDYTLNPEAIKQIAYKIKYLPTPDLKRLFEQQGGEIAFVLESQLRTRGIILNIQKANNYEEFFMDESKIYERLRWNKRQQQKDIYIPQLSTKFVQQWLKMILIANNNDKKLQDNKPTSSFCKKILLEIKNIELVVTECIKLLQMSDTDFEIEFQKSLGFTKKLSVQSYKHALIDHVFGLMIEQRIGLPIIFYARWNQKQQKIAPSKKQSDDSVCIIELILSNLLLSSQKESIFLKNLTDYIESLHKVVKYQYPYFDLQDSLRFSKKLIETLSEKMHFDHETFSQNNKYVSIFKIMIYLHVNCFQQHLKIELTKFTEIVKRVFSREDNILQIFRKNYSCEESVDLERKAEIYWQMRKNKNADEFTQDLVFCRKLMTDIASLILDQLKQNCFVMYYKEEDIKMRDELAWLKRKISETRHYSEKYEHENEFKEKEKRYTFWKKNLINLIIIEEINPVVDVISTEFLEEIRKTTSLFSQLYAIFHEIIKTTPIIFKQSAEFYKLMMAFQLMKKEEEQTYHSMSILKTLPSIQSTRQMVGGRRRSSLVGGRLSIFQPNGFDLSSILRKSAQMFTLDSLMMDQKDILFGIHAKNADTETKIKYLKQQNKLGQKTIELSRNNMWADTYPHLDENFGSYDIKIKITGQLGIDYGGVTREWINLVVKQILDPKLGLFELNVNQLAFQPSKFSYLIPNHLQIFHKFGILVGKAMKQNWLLEINFTKSFLKHMLGALLYVEDLEDIEPDTAKGLLWILKNYVDEDLGLNFTYVEQIFESKRLVELVPGGSEVFVNEMNKKQYVKKLAYTKMTENIRQQSLAFISGVEKVIPIHMLKLFNYRQIGKYLAGVSTIDPQEMKRYAKYEGYNEQDENIKWFWEVMSGRSEEDKAEFLFFLTGSYRVPYNGFRDNPITINKMSACKDYCPVAHTCFSIIDLPEYSSLQKMDKMLSRAVKEGKGFTVS